ncbi:hypothetical protein Daus18300_001892 [Diaporthe australafricana]|uniref:Uncharacterized protein n=1 Tax=Diaporthe australafricana TaxID=127596 RepID=A0ABR3XTJ5_9PEZI
MSKNQPSSSATLQKVERGRRASSSARPHFRPIPRKDEFAPYEQAVIDAGYPWVRTNPLIPTWMSPGRDPRPQTIPDRLNAHGHHGINTHLIIQGDLTLNKIKKFFGQDTVSALTLSSEIDAPKEFSVAPHEMYSGTTQQSCRFVEGRRNLSPSSARRYMSRNSLEWVDKTGRAVHGDERDYVLKQLDSAEFNTAFDFKVMQRVATCTFKEDNQVTRSMRQWFLREWNDPDVQAAKGDLRPAIHPLQPPQPPQAQEQRDHVMDDCDDGSDGSDDEQGPDGDDGSDVLIKAFQEWLSLRNK